MRWICLNCSSVVDALEYKCCGAVEAFDPMKHADRLVSGANAWRTVWNRWRDDPRVREVSNRHAETGHYSAARILNDFIEQVAGKSEGE